MKNKKVYFSSKILIITALFAMLLTGCSGRVYENSKNGYTEVDAVDGVVFDMPTEFLSQATAINLVSPKEEYIGTYVFKDGYSKYIFFNMDAIVVAAQADTDFAFSDDQTAIQVTTGNIQDISFTTSGDNIKSISADDKIIEEVNASVFVTPMQHADFTGYLASVYSEDTQWSIFAGVYDSESLTDEQKRALSHIVKSFRMTGAGYSVREEETPESNIKSDEIEDIDAQSLMADEPNELETENQIEDPQKYLQEISERIEITEFIQAGESSSIYEPLKIGKTAWFACNSANGEASINDITVVKIYAGEEAKTLLEQLNVKDKPMDGTKYQVAEYRLKKSPEEAYADLRITGLDGERLKFNGTSYTTRTHDIMDNMIVTDNGYEKLYVYYEVPDGCKEYYLTCGINVLHTDSRAVFYIKN